MERRGILELVAAVHNRSDVVATRALLSEVSAYIQQDGQTIADLKAERDRYRDGLAEIRDMGTGTLNRTREAAIADAVLSQSEEPTRNTKEMEPVAWYAPGRQNPNTTRDPQELEYWRRLNFEVLPLYLHPAPATIREPSEAQLEAAALAIARIDYSDELGDLPEIAVFADLPEASRTFYLCLANAALASTDLAPEKKG